MRFLIGDIHVRRLCLHSCPGISLSCYSRAVVYRMLRRLIQWFFINLIIGSFSLRQYVIRSKMFIIFLTTQNANMAKIIHQWYIWFIKGFFHAYASIFTQNDFAAVLMTVLIKQSEHVRWMSIAFLSAVTSHYLHPTKVFSRVVTKGAKYIPRYVPTKDKCNRDTDVRCYLHKTRRCAHNQFFDHETMKQNTSSAQTAYPQND